MKLDRTLFLILALFLMSTDRVSSEPLVPFHVARPSCARILAEISKAKTPWAFLNKYDWNYYRLWARKEAEHSRKFVHARNGNPANLAEAFVAAFDDSKAVEFYYSSEKRDPHDLIHKMGMATLAHPVSRLLGDSTLGFIVSRADEQGKQLTKPNLVVQPALPEERDMHEHQNFSLIDEMIKKTTSAYRKLYKEYGTRGRVNTDQVKLLKEEDREAASRTTHFVIHVNGYVVAHIQAQHSFDPRQKLNVEKHFGPIPRERGELVVELGRLYVAAEEELPIDIRSALQDYGGRDVIRTMLYQRAFSWLNNDAKAPKVYMQMNGKGREHFMNSGKRGFGQWQFDDPGKKVVDKPGEQEWVMSISKENLIKTEDEEMLSLLRQQREKALKAQVTRAVGYGMSANYMTFFFRENEIPVIERLISNARLPGLVEKKEHGLRGEEEPPRYDSGIQRFNPRTGYLYFRVP
jgi:hypothetical protein